MKRLGLGLVFLTIILNFNGCGDSSSEESKQKVLNKSDIEKELKKIYKLGYDYQKDNGILIWNKRIHKSCRKDDIHFFTSFSHKHSQESWVNLKSKNKIIAEWIKICPSAKSRIMTMNDKQINNLYFSCVFYANDSGEIP